MIWQWFNVYIRIIDFCNMYFFVFFKSMIWLKQNMFFHILFVCFFVIKCSCQWWHKYITKIFKSFKMNCFIDINEKIGKSQNTLIHHEIIDYLLCFFFWFSCVLFSIFFIQSINISFFVLLCRWRMCWQKTLWRVHNQRFPSSFNQFGVDTSAECYQQEKGE